MISLNQVLFSPYVVCAALITGGIAILLIEKFYRAPTLSLQSVEAITPIRSLNIGFCQCLALVPGVSRSGATILGGMMLGLDRKTATEFSFFVAIPTMLGATVFDLYKARHSLSADSITLIAIGFTTAFLVALMTVRWMIRFVQRHNFMPFGWYRIVLGTVMLGLFLLK